MTIRISTMTQFSFGLYLLIHSSNQSLPTRNNSSIHRVVSVTAVKEFFFLQRQSTIDVSNNSSSLHKPAIFFAPSWKKHHIKNEIFLHQFQSVHANYCYLLSNCVGNKSSTQSTGTCIHRSANNYLTQDSRSHNNYNYCSEHTFIQ